MTTEKCVYVVDDDDAVRYGIGLLIESIDLPFQEFESAEQFLKNYQPGNSVGCLLLDVNMPGMSGHDLQAELINRNIHIPIIFLTAYGDIPMTVRAMQAGAVDFLTKPIRGKLLLDCIQSTLEKEVKIHEEQQKISSLCGCLETLTSREHEVLPFILSGLTNKEVARQLNISYRTVEIHRARIFNKTGVKNIMELAHLCELCLPKNNKRLAKS